MQPVSFLVYWQTHHVCLHEVPSIFIFYKEANYIPFISRNDSKYMWNPLVLLSRFFFICTYRKKRKATAKFLQRSYFLLLVTFVSFLSNIHFSNFCRLILEVLEHIFRNQTVQATEIKHWSFLHFHHEFLKETLLRCVGICMQCL